MLASEWCLQCIEKFPSHFGVIINGKWLKIYKHDQVKCMIICYDNLSNETYSLLSEYDYDLPILLLSSNSIEKNKLRPIGITHSYTVTCDIPFMFVEQIIENAILDFQDRRHKIKLHDLCGKRFDSIPSLSRRAVILGEEIGTGGFGTCFKMFDRVNKVILKQTIKNVKRMECVNNEIFILKKINILQEVVNTTNSIIISMTYCGDNIKSYITNNTLSIKDKMIIFCKIVKEIHNLHVKNIYHRDLKPENICIKDNIIKIIDFGLATTDIHSNALCGTEPFIPPEKYAPHRVNINNMNGDWFSCGIIMLEIFCGFNIVKRKTTTNNIYKCLNNITFPNEDIKNIILSLIHQDPSHRFNFDMLLKNNYFLSFYKTL